MSLWRGTCWRNGCLLGYDMIYWVFYVYRRGHDIYIYILYIYMYMYHYTTSNIYIYIYIYIYNGVYDDAGVSKNGIYIVFNISK